MALSLNLGFLLLLLLENRSITIEEKYSEEKIKTKQKLQKANHWQEEEDVAKTPMTRNIRLGTRLRKITTKQSEEIKELF